VLILLSACCGAACAQWADITNVTVACGPTELAGPRVAVEYDLNGDSVSPGHPVYVFVRYSTDGGQTWRRLDPAFLRGAVDLVDKPGHKTCVWWGTQETFLTDTKDLRVVVRGIAVATVPAGRFEMKSVPGGGHDESQTRQAASELPLFHIARCETTVAMYVDYLNETARAGGGWNERMAGAQRCEITRGLIKGVRYFFGSSFSSQCKLKAPDPVSTLPNTRNRTMISLSTPFLLS
jgi:hypothetical protein